MSTPMDGAVSTAPAQERSAASERLFWLAFVSLAVLATIPLLLNEYPGMPDYPNHLARMHLLVQDLMGQTSRYYEIRHRLIPNLAMDVIVPGLAMLGVSLGVATRLFCAFALLLPVIGVACLARALHRTPPWLALLAFPIAFHRYFIYGFLNYCFSIGLALLMLALWVHLRRRSAAANWLLVFIAFSILGAGLLLSHLVGFALYAIVLMTIEGTQVLLGKDASLRAWRALSMAAVTLAAPVLFYLTMFDRGAGLRFAWNDVLAAKVAGGISPFLSYSAAIAVVTAAAITLLLLYLWRSRRLGLEAGVAWALAALAVVFLVLPTNSMGSGMLDRRVGPVVALFFFAALNFKATPRLVGVVLLVASCLTALKVYEVQSHWSESSRAFAAIREALRSVPKGARVAGYVVADGTSLESPPVRHAAAFAVIDRDAFIPNMFAYPMNGESISYREGSVGRSGLNQATRLPNGEAPDWQAICGSFDYALLMGSKAESSPSACATSNVVVRQPGLVLIKLN